MSFLSSLFGIFGGSRPSGSNVVQTSKLPEEIAPFAKFVLEEARKQYDASQEAGYTPYGGKTIADLTQEERDAMAGIKGLVGLSRPLQEEALGITRGLGDKFTADTAAEYMSPYQRAVTDIEKREAQKVFERDIMPRFEKQAVEAGGMSGLGSRAAIQASELGGRQMQQMGDIESRGLQQAYANAQQQFAQQKARERQQAADLFAAGPAMLASGLKEQGALQAIGEQKRGLEQSKLDEAYYRFLEKQAYPREKLAELSGFVYGNPLMQERVKTQNVSYAQPSFGRQLMGLAGTAAGVYGMGGGKAFGGSGFSAGNLFGNLYGGGKPLMGYGGLPRGFATGGKVYANTGGGLASLPIVYREKGGGGRSAFGRDIDRLWEKAQKDAATLREQRSGVNEKQAYQVGFHPYETSEAAVTPLDLFYSYLARSAPEHQKRLDIYNERRKEAGADFDLGRGFPPVSEDNTTAAAIPVVSGNTTTTNDVANPNQEVINNLISETAALDPASTGQIDETGGYSGLDTLQAQSAAKQDDAVPPQVRQTTGTDLLNEGLGSILRAVSGSGDQYEESVNQMRRYANQLTNAIETDMQTKAATRSRINERNFWMGVIGASRNLVTGDANKPILAALVDSFGGAFEDYLGQVNELEQQAATEEGAAKISKLKVLYNVESKAAELFSSMRGTMAQQIVAHTKLLEALAEAGLTGKVSQERVKTRVGFLQSFSSLEKITRMPKEFQQRLLRLASMVNRNTPEFENEANKIDQLISGSAPLQSTKKGTADKTISKYEQSRRKKVTDK